MNEPGKNPFDILVEQFRTVVRQEIQAASGANQQRKLLFTTKEAAEMLNIEESWVAAKARAGKIPHRRVGHYRYFSQADIDFIVAKAYVPMVHSGHDEQAVQEDTQGTGDESSTIGEVAGSDRDVGCQVGARREADIGAGGAGDEALARKKIAGGEYVCPQNGDGLGSPVSSRGPAKADNVSKLPRGGELRRKNQDPIT